MGDGALQLSDVDGVGCLVGGATTDKEWKQEKKLEGLFHGVWGLVGGWWVGGWRVVWRGNRQALYSRLTREKAF